MLRTIASGDMYRLEIARERQVVVGNDVLDLREADEEMESIQEGDDRVQYFA